MNLYRRAVGTAAQIPKAKRQDHPSAKNYFNTAALQADAGLLWACEGAFDALAHQRRVSLALSIRVVEGLPYKSLSTVPVMCGSHERSGEHQRARRQAREQREGARKDSAGREYLLPRALRCLSV